MKINAITSYQTNFGNNQVKKPEQSEKQATQPLAGLISPKKPLPPLPTITPPIGGLISPPKSPKIPFPVVPTPIGGLIAPPPSKPNIPLPTIPTPVGGLITPPPKPLDPKSIVETGVIYHPDYIPSPDDEKIAQQIKKMTEEFAKKTEKQ